MGNRPNGGPSSLEVCVIAILLGVALIYIKPTILSFRYESPGTKLELTLQNEIYRRSDFAGSKQQLAQPEM